MKYKRLELYVGWTCNQKCTYCKEFPHMEQYWFKKVSKYDILKKLLKYKKLNYNHVTFLGGEPFIQGVFFDALKIGNKLGYKILVTTNCTTLHLESHASKFLSYIDELILSFEAISIEDQQKISRTKNYVHWDKVFDNIKKYWKGSYLKANIVITQSNILKLLELVEFLHFKGVKNISITYPDIEFSYYGKNHIIHKIAPKYIDCIEVIKKILIFGKINGIFIKVVDFPFCVFPKSNIFDYIKLTDDYDYESRLKVEANDSITDRNDLTKSELLPRNRGHVNKCKECIYKNICWGVSNDYEKLYGLDEIKTIK